MNNFDQNDADNATVLKARQKAIEFKDREKLILSCALKLFLEQGEDKVTVEMIAEAAGIGKGTIYKHFQTKYEIYMQLMIQYELELQNLLAEINIDDDKDKLVRTYYNFRMADPERYALFDRLERKCIEENSVINMMTSLHKIRASNLQKLESIVNARIGEGMLMDVPAYFHICAAWAMVHGAVGLYKSDFFKQVIEDQTAFFDFLMEVCVHIGVKK